MAAAAVVPTRTTLLCRAAAPADDVAARSPARGADVVCSRASPDACKRQLTESQLRARGSRSSCNDGNLIVAVGSAAPPSHDEKNAPRVGRGRKRAIPPHRDRAGERSYGVVIVVVVMSRRVGSGLRGIRPPHARRLRRIAAANVLCFEVLAPLARRPGRSHADCHGRYAAVARARDEENTKCGRPQGEANTTPRMRKNSPS